MSPSTAVSECIGTMLEIANAPPTPNATPESADTSGRPAAMSEPSVAISTSAAIATPTISPAPISSGTWIIVDDGSTSIASPATASSAVSIVSSTVPSGSSKVCASNTNWNRAVWPSAETTTPGTGVWSTTRAVGAPASVPPVVACSCAIAAAACSSRLSCPLASSSASTSRASTTCSPS